MLNSRLLAGAAVLSLLVSPVLAQTAQPAQPTAPAQPVRPAITAPAQPVTPSVMPAKPAATAPVAAPVAAPAKPAAATTQTQGQKTNLNTAAESDLDKLPQIGPARAKAIVENRTKNGRYKDWADFTSRNVVPANAEAAIKDLIRF